jgi:hypothetical protein
MPPLALWDKPSQRLTRGIKSAIYLIIQASSQNVSTGPNDDKSFGAPHAQAINLTDAAKGPPLGGVFRFDTVLNGSLSMTNQSEFKPRLWSVRETASYWGVSPNTFKKLVREGTAPGPINAPGLGRLLFDREQQDRALDKLSGIERPSIASEDDPTWA